MIAAADPARSAQRGDDRTARRARADVADEPSALDRPGRTGCRAGQRRQGHGTRYVDADDQVVVDVTVSIPAQSQSYAGRTSPVRSPGAASGHHHGLQRRAGSGVPGMLNTVTSGRTPTPMSSAPRSAVRVERHRAGLRDGGRRGSRRNTAAAIITVVWPRSCDSVSRSAPKAQRWQVWPASVIWSPPAPRPIHAIALSASPWEGRDPGVCAGGAGRPRRRRGHLV